MPVSDGETQETDSDHCETSESLLLAACDTGQTGTVKLEKKDHLRDQQNMVLEHTQVVFIFRFNNMKSIPIWTHRMWSL